MRLLHFMAALVLWMAGQAAYAATIDFESQASAVFAPSAFDGGTDSPLKIGTATFTGGELLLQESGGADQTGVYATESLFGAYKNPLKIVFSLPVSGLSLLLTNNIAGMFTVSDNRGATSTLTLGLNASQTFMLPGSGITSVNVAETGGVYDFAIDNVTFSTGGTVAPEPSSLILMGSGLVVSLGIGWRRLFRP